MFSIESVVCITQVDNEPPKTRILFVHRAVLFHSPVCKSPQQIFIQLLLKSHIYTRIFIFGCVCVHACAHMCVLRHKCVEARKQFCHISPFTLFEMGLLLATT